MTRFGAFPDRDLRALALESGHKALADCGIDPGRVEAFYLGNFAGPQVCGQSHLAPYIAAEMGITGTPATRIEAACASGGSAFFHAVCAVAAGFYDVVLVTGVEIMTCHAAPRATEILASAADCHKEVKAGATFPALFAMIARRHMHQYGTKREHLAAVAVKNHSNALKNENAHLRKAITLEQALTGKPVAEPLTIYDCSIPSDGAASVVITAADMVRRFSGKPVRVLGIAQTSDHVALDRKPDITSFMAVQQAGARAYEMAGLSPGDIQLAELDDCFTIAEIMATEDLGFVKKGRGGVFAGDGLTALDGPLPVNPSGGLKAKGHPAGATGIAQICEIVQQIRGDAGERQVPRHDIGLTQNLGGSGATTVVTILGAA